VIAMRQRLLIATDETGIPQAQVPFSCMWDLVEYLSYQRIGVSYQYEATHFVVTFPRQLPPDAQRILDEWATSPSQLMQMA
jgi:hypothetical protein